MIQTHKFPYFSLPIRYFAYISLGSTCQYYSELENHVDIFIQMYAFCHTDARVVFYMLYCCLQTSLQHGRLVDWTWSYCSYALYIVLLCTSSEARNSDLRFFKLIHTTLVHSLSCDTIHEFNVSIISLAPSQRKDLSLKNGSKFDRAKRRKFKLLTMSFQKSNSTHLRISTWHILLRRCLQVSSQVGWSRCTLQIII